MTDQKKVEAVEGALSIDVISASIPQATKCDHFIKFTNSFTKQIFTTRKVKKNPNPTINLPCKIFTGANLNGTITLTIIRPAFFKDEVLGQLVLNVAYLANGVPDEKDFELTTESKNKSNKKGSIRLRLHYPKSEAAPVPQSNKPKSIHDAFTIGDEIGRGGFSIVKKGMNKETKEAVAIKCIEKKTTGEEEVALLHREIDIMRKLKHQHIIALYDVFEDSEKIYLVLELVTGGELFDQIVSRGVYSERDAASVIHQILEAVGYMHSNGIAHRDLKPENLLCGGPDGKQIKVTDFGLSKDFGKGNLRTSCGTPDYVAPEVLKGQTYDNSVDIWSIGVICYILLCGFPPFYGKNDQQIFEKILKANYDFPSPDWDEITDDAKEFIQAILVLEPTERPTAADCLQAPWIVSQVPSKALKVGGLNDYNTKRKNQINVV